MRKFKTKDSNIKLKVILVADEPKSQQQGLMFTKPLRDNECALFLFEKPDLRCFWNSNVDYDIDVVFLNKNFRVTSVKSLKANQLDKVCSPVDCFAVIETSPGVINKIDWLLAEVDYNKDVQVINIAGRKEELI